MVKSLKNPQFYCDTVSQEIYDSYNKFIYSKDRNLFAKLASKLFFCDLTKNIPGDVVELGVFKGSGMLAWLKANEVTSVNHKDVFGFDIFDQKKLVASTNSKDAQLVDKLFTERSFKPDGFEKILKSIILEAGFENFDLIIGNVFETVPMFLDKYPGFRASIINFDLDTYEPTAFCLEHFWQRLVPGGVMLFDEYAVKEWTESDAVDEFIADKSLKLVATSYVFPSAYLVKP